MNRQRRMVVYITTLSMLGFVGLLAAGIPFSFNAPETVGRDVPPALGYILFGGVAITGTLQFVGLWPEKWGIQLDDERVETAGTRRIVVEICAMGGFLSLFLLFAQVGTGIRLLEFVPWYVFLIIMAGCAVVAETLRRDIV